MRKTYSTCRRAFTLIEVIIAVIIISIVIMALLTMYANNTHILSSLKAEAKSSAYLSTLLYNENYGFEDKEKYMNDLLYDFNLDDDLRRELKNIKVEIMYQELDTIDMRDENKSSAIVFEVGKTILKTSQSSNALFRLRIQ